MIEFRAPDSIERILRMACPAWEVPDAPIEGESSRSTGSADGPMR